MLVFSFETSCAFVGRWQRFGGTYCPYLQVSVPTFRDEDGESTAGEVS
jgi:hypothetical protein